MYHDSPVTPLVHSAANGSESAWREIVDRYAPLVFAVCRRCGINGADADDVCASVWLQLVKKLDSIREPEALPGWLRTTARRESLMLLRHKNRHILTDSALIDEPSDPELDAILIGRERRAATHDAFAQLPRRDRELLSMLFSDPPKTYKEISATLGIPVGAIGPSRARCLTRARRTPAIAALFAKTA